MSGDSSAAPTDGVPSRIWPLLTGILLLAIALRLWSATHGLPYIYNPDEHFEVYRALRLGMGVFDFERITKGGYFYLLFVEYGVYFVVLKLAGAVDSTQAFARSIIEDPSAIWIIGRATTAVIGTINVFVVYRIGSRLGGHVVGMASAFIMAVAYLPVVHSHYITVDVPLTCLLSVALFYALGIAQDDIPNAYVKAGVFAGLASITKLPGVLVMVPIVVAHLMRAREPAKRSFTNIGVCFSAFTLVYGVGNPGILWRFVEITKGVVFIFTAKGDPAHGQPLEMKETTNAWLYYLEALRDGAGLPVLLLAGAGVCIALVTRQREGLILAAFGAATYVVLAMAKDPNMIYARYVLPIIPVIAVLAADAVVKGASAMRIRQGYDRMVVASVILIVSLPTLQSSLAWNKIHSRKDTRTIAKEWIESNVPPSSKVWMRGNPEENSQLVVPLESTGENLRRMSELHERENPGKAIYLRMRAALAKEPAYDIETTQVHEPWPSWDACKASGAEYVILRDIFDPNRRIPTAGIPRSEYEFNSQLVADPAAVPMVAFDPRTLGSPGPYLRIFRITPQADVGPKLRPADP